MRQQDVFLLPDGRHGCGRGLQLVVKNNGKSRSWILRLSHGGRRYEFGLGAENPGVCIFLCLARVYG